MKPLTGGCLCGNIRFAVTGSPLSQGVCYCSKCRKAGASFGSPLLVLSKSDFKCAGKTLAKVITPSDRGSIVSRSFCRDCGSHIFAEISDLPGLVTIRGASLDDPSALSPEYLVFTEGLSNTVPTPKGLPSFPGGAPLEVLLGVSTDLNRTPLTYAQDGAFDSATGCR